MKTLFTIIISFNSLLVFTQDTLSLDFQFDKKYSDSFALKNLNDGSFIIFSIRRKHRSGKADVYPGSSASTLVFWYDYIPIGFHYDASGALIEKSDSKKLEEFINEENTLYLPANPNALNQKHINYIFNNSDGKLYKWLSKNGSIVLDRVSFNGESDKLWIKDWRIFGGARLTSWNTQLINDSTYRHLLIYNERIKSKITIVQVDFNWKNSTYDIKSELWDNQLIDINGWDRPRFEIKSVINDTMYCSVKGSGKTNYVSLNKDLEPVEVTNKFSMSYASKYLNNLSNYKVNHNWFVKYSYLHNEQLNTVIIDKDNNKVLLIK